MNSQDTRRTKHMSATVEWVRGFLRSEESQGRAQAYLSGEDGPVTFEAAHAYLDSLQADGIQFITGCGDTNPDGSCAGHAAAREGV